MSEDQLNIGALTPIDIEEDLKKSFMAYAMAVIVSRALPDVRDGLKPVHRRILYSMMELGVTRFGIGLKSALKVLEAADNR